MMVSQAQIEPDAYFLPVLQNADDDNEPDHGAAQRNGGHQDVLGRCYEQLHFPACFE